MGGQQLEVIDYIVIVMVFLVSAGIGVGVHFFESKKQTPKNFLMAGGNAPMFPVILSIVVSIMSSIELLGSSELYRYGSQIMMMEVGMVIGMVVSTYVFIPVFFKSGVSTVHEFLELRYGRKLQYIISALFIIQIIFFMSAVLFGSVIALTAVTDFSMEVSIVIIGLVCSFYCSLGGLKAVLWTDVFQAALMFINVIIIYTKGVQEAGGISAVFQKASLGNRIHFFNFDTDLTTRYTFWNSLTRSLVGSMAYFGCSQLEVQRMLSLSSNRRAKQSLLWSITPVVLLVFSCQLIGLILFAIFIECDPVQDSGTPGVTRYDQLVPYYILSRMGAVPGLTGLCAAGIFSGALSTVSSALNSLSTVTVVDFLRPLWPTRLSESRTLLIARALSLLYGLICIAFTFAISNTDSLLGVTSTLVSIMEGPMLAIFVVGVLSRKADEKCALFGLLLGLAFTCWIGYGIIFGGYVHPAYPLDVSGCPSNSNSTFDIMSNVSLSDCTEVSGSCASTVAPHIVKEPFILYKVSYMWIAQIGFLITLIGILIAVLVTGGFNKNVIPADSKCLASVTKLWLKTENTKSESEKEIELQEKSALNETSRKNSERLEAI